jgi:hypothetical protein
MSLVTCRGLALPLVDSCDSLDRYRSTEMEEQALSRKTFLATGAGAVGALAVPTLARAAGTPKQQPVYKLKPNGHTCKACATHDANTIFPSAKAANGNRAHIGCNCTIVQGTIDFGTFVALFGNPKQLESYRANLRSARNQAVLQNHAPVFPS